jgi:hypothetical protein
LAIKILMAQRLLKLMMMNDDGRPNIKMNQQLPSI